MHMTAMTYKSPIRVYYVTDKKDNGKEVVAIFIDEPATLDIDMLTCYVHFGQHGQASLGWVKQNTIPASESEYIDLDRELRDIYTDNYLVVCPKIDKFARGNRKQYLKDLMKSRSSN